MNKLKMQTPDITNKNIENILKLFPNVATEVEGKKAIDFDSLRQMLSEDIVEGDEERYRLDWPGKKASLLKANTPINKTLRPCEDESVDFENTQNLYIEGDNFEVLKILSESYLNKVKMIYIDPPYNTGKDFVYKDNFTKSKDEFEDDINLRDEEGNKLFKNTDTNGRFHSDWLSMMYERLLVARDLLKEDGVIFISIDDNEVHNLRKICDEVFGERNFVGKVIRKTRTSTNHDEVGLNTQHEYCLLYSKSLEYLNIIGKEKTFDNYTNPDDDICGDWTSAYPGANLDGRTKVNNFEIINPYTGKIDLPPEGNHWRFNEDSLDEMLKSGKIIFKKKHKENERGFILKRYKNEIRSKYHLLNSLEFATNEYLNQVGTRERNEIFEKDIFDYPKPVNFIKSFVHSINDTEAIILDFFSGSATTAHAVMDLNAQDGGNRKFIMVQLPENTDEKEKSYKAGYKTIAEIGKERIRRAGKKILNDKFSMLNEKDNSKLNTQNSTLNLDIGFRVLKTDTTNFKDVYYHPSKTTQEQLQMFESNIKEDRTHLDLLFAIMIDLGIELSLKITPQKIDNKTIYSVENSELIACFENNISEAVIEEIIKQKPYQVVLKEDCFKNDSEKINIIQKLSTITTVSVI